MGRQVPWDDIPASGLLPNGIYDVEIESLEENTSASGKLMYKLTARVIEPDAFAGNPVWERYTIGSETDPDATDPLTWRGAPGARFMKTMLAKAQVPQGDMDEVCAAAVGSRFIAVVGSEITNQGATMNRIQGTYALGEKSPGLEGEAPARRPAAPAPAPRQAPTSAPRQPAPAGRPAPAPAPTPAPAPRRAPAPAPAPAPRAAAAAPAKAATVLCRGCNEQIERAAYGDHVETCPGLNG